MSIDWMADEYRSALADMSPGELQDGCEHHANPNRHGECPRCGAWQTDDGNWI